MDCDWGKKHADLSEKYGIGGYPTVVFTDPDGKEVARMTKRDPESLVKQIGEIAEKHGKKKK